MPSEMMTNVTPIPSSRGAVDQAKTRMLWILNGLKMKEIE